MQKKAEEAAKPVEEAEQDAANKKEALENAKKVLDQHKIAAPGDGGKFGTKNDVNRGNSALTNAVKVRTRCLNYEGLLLMNFERATTNERRLLRTTGAACPKLLTLRR